MDKNNLPYWIAVTIMDHQQDVQLLIKKYSDLPAGSPLQIKDAVYKLIADKNQGFVKEYSQMLYDAMQEKGVQFSYVDYPTGDGWGSAGSASGSSGSSSGSSGGGFNLGSILNPLGSFLTPVTNIFGSLMGSFNGGSDTLGNTQNANAVTLNAMLQLQQQKEAAKSKETTLAIVIVLAMAGITGLIIYNKTK